ncbi:MAG: hypothetical protein C4292_04465 [Nitrososphaera sp.]
MLRYYVAFAVAVISDLLDYTAVGALPVMGDAIDAVTIFVLYALIGKSSIIGVAEFVPFLYLFPTYTIAVAWAYYRAKKKQRRQTATL